ncbi:MAG: hypothetical protein IJC37_07980 [Clostridia bacterium]|nr:hypothetical protein [Clostridia bacterium]
MKRFFCILLCLSMIFSLCSCSDSGNEAETSSTAQTTSPSTTAQTQQDNTVIAQDVGFRHDLLPATFPDISDFEIISTSVIDAENDYGYQGEFYRIQLTATAAQITLLNGRLLSNGWFGSSIIYDKEDFGGQVMFDLPEGFWQNGEHLALISKFDADVTAYEFKYLLYLDIIKADFGLPDEITEFFPDINAAHMGAGTLSIYDINGKAKSFSSGFNKHNWRWDFIQGAAFCAVNGIMFDEYVQALRDAGFAVNTSENTDKYGSYTMVAADKNQGSKTYTVSLIYYRYTYTLQASFTNNAEFFIS